MGLLTKKNLKKDWSKENTINPVSGHAHTLSCTPCAMLFTNPVYLLHILTVNPYAEHMYQAQGANLGFAGSKSPLSQSREVYHPQIGSALPGSGVANGMYSFLSNKSAL